VDSTLEWFILQVHPTDEGQMPPDLSQAQTVIDKVQLDYLTPGSSNLQHAIALDPAYHMLVPAWIFSGHITTAGPADLIFKVYVQATNNPRNLHKPGGSIPHPVCNIGYTDSLF